MKNIGFAKRNMNGANEIINLIPVALISVCLAQKLHGNIMQSIIFGVCGMVSLVGNYYFRRRSLEGSLEDDVHSSPNRLFIAIPAAFFLVCFSLHRSLHWISSFILAAVFFLVSSALMFISSRNQSEESNSAVTRHVQ